MNPVLDIKMFIPDAEAHKMPDGRLYIYGSLDHSGDTEFCSTKYVTFSTDDMVHWVDHGEIFNSTDQLYDLNTNLTLGAPDCLYIHGKYYLYYCAYGNGMGVAVADHPAGPFKNLGSVTPADGDSIDPAIFQDDDGSIYYFWGQFNLRGGKLADDMKTVIPETIELNLLNEFEHGFHEGASIRKIGKTYYMVYTDVSRGTATCLAYATADHPLGPYEKKGIIIDNAGCDSSSWNNHGSIEEFNGQYYVFYHRSSQNSIYNRRLCIEKIVLDENGSIAEVPMTTNGVMDFVLADQEIPVSALSKMRMKLPFDHLEPMRLEPAGDCETLSFTRAGDWIQFDHLNFGDGCTRFSAMAASIKPAKLEIYIDGNKKIGECTISETGSWNDYRLFETEISKTSGVHTIWLRMMPDQKSVGRLANLKAFRFK